ncbi:12477_t:CDS:2 [Funneliformis mosseae]|uniref:12477_t:CDS:1 n=1 Tax=Funneliformis mosseae TaxID=27381 RepID=A0A9N9CC13_FUNMO|nr:12477_t:CDS:2 [Funneliformis mosseae]
MQYFFVSGPDTGKSRSYIGQQLSVLKTLELGELKVWLNNAWIFNTSFENGYINSNYEASHSFEVLELVTKFENRKLDDVAVILVVDGMHNMMNEFENDGTNQTSPIEMFLAISSRFRKFLPIISLKPPILTIPDGIKQDIFDMNNSVIKLLVGDCGGHDRSLEILIQYPLTFNYDNEANRRKAIIMDTYGYRLWLKSLQIENTTS